jgi:hypothetical protein
VTSFQLVGTFRQSVVTSFQLVGTSRQTVVTSFQLVEPANPKSQKSAATNGHSTQTFKPDHPVGLFAFIRPMRPDRKSDEAAEPTSPLSNQIPRISPMF